MALPGAPALKAGVAEQEPVPIQERSDGCHISAPIHNGEFGLCQPPDCVKNLPVPQVFPALDQMAQVLGDE